MTQSKLKAPAVGREKNPGKYLTEGIPGNPIYLFVIGQKAKAAFKIIGISHLWKSDVSRVKSRQSEAQN